MNLKYNIEISLSSFTKKYFKEEKDYKKLMNHYKLLQKSFPDRVSMEENRLSTKKNTIHDVKLYCLQNEVKFFTKQIEDLDLTIESINTRMRS